MENLAILRQRLAVLRLVRRLNIAERAGDGKQARLATARGAMICQDATHLRVAHHQHGARALPGWQCPWTVPEDTSSLPSRNRAFCSVLPLWRKGLLNQFDKRPRYHVGTGGARREDVSSLDRAFGGVAAAVATRFVDAGLLACVGRLGHTDLHCD